VEHNGALLGRSSALGGRCPGGPLRIYRSVNPKSLKYRVKAQKSRADLRNKSSMTDAEKLKATDAVASGMLAVAKLGLAAMQQARSTAR